MYIPLSFWGYTWLAKQKYNCSILVTMRHWSSTMVFKGREECHGSGLILTNQPIHHWIIFKRDGHPHPIVSGLRWRVRLKGRSWTYQPICTVGMILWKRFKRGILPIVGWHEGETLHPLLKLQTQTWTHLGFMGVREVQMKVQNTWWFKLGLDGSLYICCQLI